MDPAGGFGGWDGDGGEHGAYVEGDLGEGSGVDYGGISIIDHDHDRNGQNHDTGRNDESRQCGVEQTARHGIKQRPAKAIAFPPDGYCDRMHRHMASAPETWLSHPIRPSSRWSTQRRWLAPIETLSLFLGFGPHCSILTCISVVLLVSRWATRPPDRGSVGRVRWSRKRGTTAAVC